MKFICSLIRPAALLLLLLTVNLQFSAFAQDTAFTYQGRLNDGANPANGSYDVTFTLFATNTTGVAIAGPVTNAATAVSNGLFTATLDFGNQFPGAARWLEIGVRTNGAGSFFTLSPRQALTPTPYAIFAAGANAAGLNGTVPTANFSGTYGSAVTLNNSANQFTGSFSGNGANVTNVNAASLGGLASSNFWQLGGNNVAAGKFLGSTNNQPVEIWVNNQRALRLEPTPTNGAVNVIAGSLINKVDAGVVGATIAGGGTSNFNGVALTNWVRANYGTVGGGAGNLASNVLSTVVGGYRNTASGFFSTAMGYGSTASGNASTAMGFNSTASGLQSTAMGLNSAASGDHSTAMGASTATNSFSTALGSSTANGDHSTAMGNSTASGQYSTAMGNGSSANGIGSTALGSFSSAANTNSTALGNSIAAGNYSTAAGQSAAVGDFSTAMGGATAKGQYSTAMGNSTANGQASSAMGFSTASGDYSTAMGASTATNSFSTAMGNSTAEGVSSTAMGQSTANGYYSTAMGASSASGAWSFAAGALAKANHQGAFVWADNQFTDFASTAPNQFLIRASGGVGIGLNNPAGALHVASSSGAPQFQITQNNTAEYTRLRMNVSGNPSWEMDVSPGATPSLTFWNSSLRMTIDYSGNVSATSFNPSSDRNLKENFSPVSPREVLDKVAALPITHWNFKDDAGTKHVGPMAQDFYAAFGVGPDDKHIATVDADGVALAAIQGLNQKLTEKDVEIQELKQGLAELKQLVGKLAGERNEAAQ